MLNKFFPVIYNKLRVVSYNCQSFACKVQSIAVSLEECEILLLQETLLAEPQLSSLNLSDDFQLNTKPFFFQFYSILIGMYVLKHKQTEYLPP